MLAVAHVNVVQLLCTRDVITSAAYAMCLVQIKGVRKAGNSQIGQGRNGENG